MDPLPHALVMSLTGGMGRAATVCYKQLSCMLAASSINRTAPQSDADYAFHFCAPPFNASVVPIRQVVMPPNLLHHQLTLWELKQTWCSREVFFGQEAL